VSVCLRCDEHTERIAIHEAMEDEKRRMAEKAAAIEAKYARQQSSAPSAAPVPNFRVNDDGGEASMSIGDSNALRASLGLKPLVQDSASKDDIARTEHRRHLDRKRGREQAKEEREKIERTAEKKEQQRIDAALKSTKGLGVGTQDEDDDVLVCTS
jgi:crotonobetainyl-CoA:carnitine CoA-transferase CaiB-like acyl-CoA transferase